MCILTVIPDKFAVTLEFLLWLCFQGGNFALNFLVWLLLGEAIRSCDLVVNATTSLTNVSDVAQVDLYCAGNLTDTVESLYLRSDLKKLWDLDYMFISFLGAGGAVFAIHILLRLPYMLKYLIESDWKAYLPNGHRFFVAGRRRHFWLDFLTFLVGDIPLACLTMEVLHYLWIRPGGVNCWECKLTNSTTQSAESITQTYLLYSIVGISANAAYKGMVPLILWLGNVYCMPCICLRFVTALPAGLIIGAMVLMPSLGVYQSRLQGILGSSQIKGSLTEASNLLFLVGIVFWVLFILGGLAIFCIWYAMCRSSD